MTGYNELKNTAYKTFPFVDRLPRPSRVKM